MKRRDFVRAAAATVAAAASGVLWRPGRAHAFGEVPEEVSSLLLPDELRAVNVLEIFLFGGVSQYESFYCVEEFGQDGDDPSQWHLSVQDGSLEEALQACSFPGGDLLEPFAVDEAGNTVNFGPFAMPLRARGDILDRTRVMVQKHELLPHELAIPLALTGRSPARPDAAGLGTHVQRYFQDRDGTGNSGIPSAYVFLTKSELQNEFVSHATAAGKHPGAARPLSLRFDQSSGATDLFNRRRVSSSAATDAFVRDQMAAYRQRLVWNGTELPSTAVVDHAYARALLEKAPQLSSVLSEDYFLPIQTAACEQPPLLDTTAMGLRLATRLLNDAQNPARYICVVDGGLQVSTDAGGYDTHAQNCMVQASNLVGTLQRLADSINAPGEADPTKIDLDRTLVIINTEFGRTPRGEGDRGRGHWPFGYPTLYIGGPVRRGARGIRGSYAETARAPTFTTPTESRIAALLAMGIWPFSAESYNVSDLTVNETESEGAVRLLREHFGYAAS